MICESRSQQIAHTVKLTKLANMITLKRSLYAFTILDYCTSVRVGHVTNLCASTQWEMTYWLALCFSKIGACVVSYGWPCSINIRSVLDCMFVQGLTEGNCHRGRENPYVVWIYQFQRDYTNCKTQMKLGILLLEHNELFSVWEQPI